MKKTNLQYVKFAVLAVALPFIYGCGAGAGVGSLVGFLFGGGGLTGGELLIAGGGGPGGVPSGVATLVNPEPASMLLVGSGLMAMGYFKSKTNRQSK